MEEASFTRMTHRDLCPSTLFVVARQTPPVYISCIIFYIFFLCLSPVLYSIPTSVCLFCIFFYLALF